MSNLEEIYLIQESHLVRDRYDFFLVSQSVNQGTVSPTHFNVVVDGGGLKPDHMQRLTYKLCHLYYNWPVCYLSPCVCVCAYLCVHL